MPQPGLRGSCTDTSHILLGASQYEFTIPSAVPSGTYLLRIEHLGVHNAANFNGAQFFVSCAQINVKGGGSGIPGPLVSFPGAYSATDPGIFFNTYYPPVSEAFCWEILGEKLSADLL